VCRSDFQHIHAQTRGGATPALVADLAGHEELSKMLMVALDTQVKGDLPLEFHAVGTAQNLLHVGGRRDAAYTVGVRGDVPTWDRMYSRLYDYKQTHKNCEVPRVWETDQQLSNWVNTQRVLKKEFDSDDPCGEMTAERVQSLTVLGMAWHDPAVDDLTAPLETIQHDLTAPLETIQHKTYSTIANCHSHRHMATCLSGKMGLTGCRMCMSAAHGSHGHRHEPCTTCCFEVKPKPPGYSGDDDIDLRCEYCYAGGSKDELLRFKADETRKISDIIATKPCTIKDPNVADHRILAVELGRSCPPEPLVSYGAGFNPKEEKMWEALYERLVAYKEAHDDCNVPRVWETDQKLSDWCLAQKKKLELGEGMTAYRMAKLVWVGFDGATGPTSAETSGNALLDWTEKGTGSGDRTPKELREELRKILNSRQPFGALLRTDGLKDLREKLHELAKEPAAEDSVPVDQSKKKASEAAEERLLKILLDAWSKPELMCKNALIAEWSPALASCLGSNANAIQMGAGAAGKSASIYQAKYSSKEGTDISTAVNVLRDCERRIRAYPSGAIDSGDPDRIAKHYCQHVLNKSAMELPAVVAASVVLGLRSSYYTDEPQMHQAWDFVRLALSIDQTLPSADSNLDSNPVLAADLDIAAAEDEDDDDGDEADDTDEKAGDDGADLEIVADAEGGAADEAVDSMQPDVDLMAQVDELGGSRLGTSMVYTDDEGNRVAISSAQFYAARDKKLQHFTGVEFDMLFLVVKAEGASKKWLKAALEKPPGGEADATAGAEAKKGRKQNPRFLFIEEFALSKTHYLHLKSKWGYAYMAGAPPPRRHRNITSRKKFTKAERDIARYYGSNLIPWDRANKPLLSPAAWKEWQRRLALEAGCLVPEVPEKETELRNAVKERFDLGLSNFTPAERERVASGRLFILENMLHGLEVDRENAKKAAQVRSRCRHLWADAGGSEPRPAAGGRWGTEGTAGYKDAAEELERLNADAEERRNGTNIMAKRMESSHALSAFADGLCARLPMYDESDMPAVEANALYPADSVGYARTWQGYRKEDAKAAALAMEVTLGEDDITDDTSTDADAATAGDDDDDDGDGELGEITVEEWEVEYEKWKAEGKEGRPPMNPEQRNAVRGPVVWMRHMAAQARLGLSVQQAFDAGMSKQLRQVTGVHGPGGTGKSEVIHVLDRFLKERKFGRMAITAQTGVAAAQFLAPTLQKLVSIGAFDGNPKESLSGEQVCFTCLVLVIFDFVTDCHVFLFGAILQAVLGSTR
jgi:hypothetical protein